MSERNHNYSVITNFGCHHLCPYCITKKTGMRLPETDIYEVSRTVLGLIDMDDIYFLSFSGGGDPMHGVSKCQDMQRATWYGLLAKICRDHDVETEMHTSAETLRRYMWDREVIGVLEEFDRVVYHCMNTDDLQRVNAAFRERNHYPMMTIRAVFVVTPGMTAEMVDQIEEVFRSCHNVWELTFRQMVDGNFVPDGTLRDYLLEGHREGRWHYTEQDDYNRYIVNGLIFDRFEDIAREYGHVD